VLDPDENERLDTWIGMIAQDLRPGAPVAATPDGLRVGRKGSLAVTAADGWYDHEASKGGRDTLSLIAHLRSCKPAGAVLWARTWLAEHPGHGDLSADAVASTDAGERRSTYTRQVLDETGDPLATPAEAYLQGRNLAPPYPPCVQYLADARTGEGAVVGILTDAAGERLGVQLGYLDPQGRKSAVPPYRQLFFSADTRDQAAFRIRVGEPGDDAAPLVIVEGLEDALSIAQAGAALEVLGIPGISRFGKLDLSAGAEVVVFRDGDAADSEAAKHLSEAVDRWLLGGVRIWITDTAAGEDANSILQANGPAELRRLIAEAEPAELSFDADVVQLAGLKAVDYERQRTDAAKRHNVRVTFLDAAVRAARAEAEPTAESEDDEAPHAEPIADIAVVLDQALAEVRDYISGAETELAAAVLWCMHAHLVHHERIRLPITPKLAIQSPDKGCGKTTLLEIVSTLVPRPETGSSITAAATFRLIEARKPTLLIDEADRIIRPGGENAELLAVLNSGHRRSGAHVWRTEEIGGERNPVQFSTWGAVALAGIRELPPTLQDRSIVVRLSRARPGEVKKHLRHGTSPVLRRIKRKFARWAADLMWLPEPELPDTLNNRQGDNWQPLLAIADAAGGRWPALAREAAVASLAADEREGVLIALLDGLRRAFGDRDRLSTQAILEFLLADDEHDWAIANNGRAVNEAWLRERLRNVIAPTADGRPGSERWGGGNNKERGYSRHRFIDAWQRYLSLTAQNYPAHAVHPAPPLKTKGNSGPDGPEHIRPPQERAWSPVPGNGAGPDTESDGAGCKKGHVARKNPTKSTLGPDGPDGPDDSGSKRKDVRPNGELGPEEPL
jgi:hypothetical protein